MKDFPTDDNGLEDMTFFKLVKGNEELEKAVMGHSKSEDDPPLLFGWKPTVLREFWNKAVTYGAGGGVELPPRQISGGVHPVGQATFESIEQLQHEILSFVSSQSLNPPLIGGETGGAVGLACTGLQFIMAGGELNAMEHLPWFQAVLATGVPLTGCLAKVYMPRPKVQLGVCDLIPFTTRLWS